MAALADYLVMIPTLQTPRMILRPLELADAEQVQALFPKWEVVRYLRAHVPWPYPPDGAYQYYWRVLQAIERGDEWHWMLTLRNNPSQVVGSIALMKDRDENRGFWLALPWHGQGLMTEACEVVTDYWFNTLKFPVLRVPKAVANTASRHISERQGMRVVAIGERDYVCGRLATEIWEITAEEWRARQPKLREQNQSC